MTSSDRDSRYGDPSVIRALASDFRDRATRLRHEADRLVARADGTGWTGRAAEAMRRRARERAIDLRRTAALHEEASDALLRHAREVERRLEEIAAIERRVHALVEAARSRLAQAAGGLVDRLLDRFVPPPPGHRDWLDVDLPGARR